MTTNPTPVPFEPNDILLLNPTIIDGSGTTPRYQANVLIRNGHIHRIYSPPILLSTNDHATTTSITTEIRVIDCTSPDSTWILSPGFIDMHAHSDLSLLHTPLHEAKISQGVTTEVIGQDGISYAPVHDDTSMQRIRRQIAGWNGNPSSPRDFFDRWRSVGEYLDVLDAEGIATNAAYLVPQGNLRILAKGWDSSPATRGEMERMKDVLRSALEEGAVGMSSGLTYVPGMFASTSELEELCSVVREYGGYYCPHTRSYGKGALEAYAEMIRIAKKTGVRLHLTHATLNFEENTGKAGELLAMVDEAIGEGVEVSLDTYPYLPGSTTLAATLPSWAASASDPAGVLSDPEQLVRIREQALVTGTDGCHGCTLDWSLIEISGVGNPALATKYVGKTIARIAQDKSGGDRGEEDPFDTYIRILKEDDLNSTILFHAGHEGNVRAIMRHSRHTGGSDGILTSTRPHPRGWGTFPRYLGEYARDLPRGNSRDIYHPMENAAFENVEPETVFEGGLEEAVAHLTGRAAEVIGLRDRGLVKEGYRADLVLWNSEEIRDAATFQEPKQRAKGIRVVLVNGIFAVDEGEMTGARAGKTVRLRKEEEEVWVVR